MTDPWINWDTLNARIAAELAWTDWPPSTDEELAAWRKRNDPPEWLPIHK